MDSKILRYGVFLLVSLASFLIASFLFLPEGQAQESSTTTIRAFQDTWINSGSSNNWGTWNDMQLGAAGYLGNMQMMLQFDLDDLPDQIAISSATLQAYYDMCGGECTDMDTSIHRLTKEWDESTANWPQMGDASDARVYSTQVIGDRDEDDRWVEWDVTDLVREWYSGTYPNYGLAVHGQRDRLITTDTLQRKRKGEGWQARLVIDWEYSANPTSTPTSSPTSLPPTPHAEPWAFQDTWINSGSSNNWGSWSDMQLGAVGYLGNMRMLLQFDLDEMPHQASLSSATLQAYYDMCGGECTDMDTSIHRLTKEWDESTANWPKMEDASDARVYSTQVIGDRDEDDRWVEWDVTDLVREWYSGTYPNYGLAVHGQEGPPDNYRYFTTKEKGEGWQARLVMVWETPTPTATVTLTATNTPTITPTHTVTLTPTFTPTPLSLYLPLINDRSIS